MGLETGTYIDSLNTANPTATDPKSEGDDHLRLLKSTIKSTLPNVTGAVTATHTELNLLDGVTSTTAELNILDGVTATTAELNLIDGVTATTAELNYTDGVTSAIQTQIDTKQATITNNAVTDTAQTFTASQRGEVTTLTSATTVTPDFAASNNYTLTLGHNVIMANPTNLTAGQSGSIFAVQDGTGSRTMAFGSYWDFAGGTAPTMTTTASGIDRIDYVVRSSTSIHAIVTLALS